MKAVARAKRAEPDKYGETKQRYMFMLTETASTAIDVAAENLGITRSELLERIIRREFVKPNRTDEAAAS